MTRIVVYATKEEANRDLQPIMNRNEQICRDMNDGKVNGADSELTTLIGLSVIEYNGKPEYSFYEGCLVPCEFEGGINGEKDDQFHSIVDLVRGVKGRYDESLRGWDSIMQMRDQGVPTSSLIYSIEGEYHEERGRDFLKDALRSLVPNTVRGIKGLPAKIREKQESSRAQRRFKKETIARLREQGRSTINYRLSNIKHTLSSIPETVSVGGMIAYASAMFFFEWSRNDFVTRSLTPQEIGEFEELFFQKE
ncbi:hypothetical protein ACFL0X_01390 [Nanoarchaeota archaeon]